MYLKECTFSTFQTLDAGHGCEHLGLDPAGTYWEGHRTFQTFLSKEGSLGLPPPDWWSSSMRHHLLVASGQPRAEMRVGSCWPPPSKASEKEGAGRGQHVRDVGWGQLEVTATGQKGAKPARTCLPRPQLAWADLNCRPDIWCKLFSNLLTSVRHLWLPSIFFGLICSLFFRLLTFGNLVHYYLSLSSFLMEAFKHLFEKHCICIPQDFKKLFICLFV